jgi:hypothetical protein
VIAGKQGKSDDGWEVLDEQAAGRKPVEGGEVSAVMSDSVLREEDDQGWDEARREA